MSNNEFKVGDKVLVEVEVTDIYPSGRIGMMREGHIIVLGSEQIYSRVPEIKPSIEFPEIKGTNPFTGEVIDGLRVKLKVEEE